MFNDQFMQLAIQEAEAAFERGEVPVGAVIVSRAEKRVIARAHNLVELTKDPCAHAEMLAIKEACNFFDSKVLVDCDIYVTLEPCVMCAGAISYAKISRLYYGAPDVKFGAIENGPQIYRSNLAIFRPEVYNLMQYARSNELLKSFFSKLR